MRHRIAHWLHWNLGTVVSALDERGTVWIGFRCATCGKVSGITCGKVSGIHATQPPPMEHFT